MDLRRKKVVATLVFPIKAGEVLLAKKTRKIGVGKWNGWGGAVEEGETVRQAAVRELHAESGLIAKPEALQYFGKITFHNQKPDGRKLDVDVHLFLLHQWEGRLTPNNEMVEPTFWPVNNLPFDNMMASDKEWLPLVLSGQTVEGEVWYGTDQSVLLQPSQIRQIQPSDIN